MRILLSAYACDPGAGTEPGNGWNWATHLAEAGHDVWVLTGVGDRSRRLEHARGVKNLHIVDVPTPSLEGFLRYGGPGVYLHYLLWRRRSYRIAQRLVRSRHFDLAHHVTWGSLMWGSPLWRLGIPFVFGPVGGGQVAPRSLVRYLSRHRWSERLRARVFRPAMHLNLLARAAILNAAVVFATNTDTERLVRDLGAKSVYLLCDTAVPPGMLGASPSRLGAQSDIAILWLARLLPRKGLPLALHALSRIARDVEWSCTLVGDGPLSPEVPGWLKRLRIDDRTTWLGGVPWSEVGHLYEEADVFLFTSLRDASGAQLYEAAAFGLPIVGLAHQGVADLIPDDVAVKVPVGDPDQTAQGLASAIEVLARAPEKRREMGLAARRFAERNTWAARVQEAYSIIEFHLPSRTS